MAITFPSRNIYKELGSSTELRREDRTEDKDSNAFCINVIVKDLNL